jgi:hypothetical protein
VPVTNIFTLMSDNVKKFQLSKFCQHRQVVEAVFFRGAATCSLVGGNQRFGGRHASIFRVEVRALLPTQRGS